MPSVYVHSLCKRKDAFIVTRGSNVRSAATCGPGAAQEPRWRLGPKATRREIAGLLGPFVFIAPPSKADVLTDAAKYLTRGSGQLSKVDAVVALMDAAAVLQSVQALATTPLDAEERRLSRSMLPTFAKYLRKVGPAVAELSGAPDDQLSSRYGGNRGDGTLCKEEQVLLAVGKILTLSGRTLRPEALAEDSQIASEARNAISGLLTALPPGLVSDARVVRESRRKHKES